MGGGVVTVARRARDAFVAGDPESGWLGRLVGTGVIVGMLVTAREPAGWVWAGLAVAVAGWLVYVVTDPRVRVLPLVALATAALTAAATTGVAFDSTGAVITYVALAMFAVHPVPRPMVTAGLAAAVTVVAAVSWPAAGRTVQSLLLFAGVAAFITLSGSYRRQYHLRAAQTAVLLDQTRRARDEQARAAALDERTRIAREIHDVLAHSLGALGVQLEVAEALLAEQGDVDGALERLRRSRRLAAEGLAEARSAVSALRSDVTPLPDALVALAAEHGRNHPGVLQVEIVGPPRPLPAPVGVSLAGTAREALTNAARHAPGAAVRVELAFAPDTVRLTVCNTAPAEPVPDRRDPPGNGLTGMRERLALVGGRLHAGRDGAGWTVSAEVALPADGLPSAEAESRRAEVAS